MSELKETVVGNGDETEGSAPMILPPAPAAVGFVPLADPGFTTDEPADEWDGDDHGAAEKAPTRPSLAIRLRSALARRPVRIGLAVGLSVIVLGGAWLSRRNPSAAPEAIVEGSPEGNEEEEDPPIPPAPDRRTGLVAAIPSPNRLGGSEPSDPTSSEPPAPPATLNPPEQSNSGVGLAGIPDLPLDTPEGNLLASDIPGGLPIPPDATEPQAPPAVVQQSAPPLSDAPLDLPLDTPEVPPVAEPVAARMPDLDSPPIDAPPQKSPAAELPPIPSTPPESAPARTLGQAPPMPIAEDPPSPAANGTPVGVEQPAPPATMPPLNVTPTTASTSEELVPLRNRRNAHRTAVATTGAVAGATAASLAETSIERTASRRDDAEPIVHTVRSGENFWTISRYYYGSARYWKALWAANSATVRSPESLEVGVSIKVPMPESLDRSLVERADTDPEPSVKSLPRGTQGSTNVDRSAARTTLNRESTSAVVPKVVRSTPRSQASPDESRPSSRAGLPVYSVRRNNETLRSIARDQLGDSSRAQEILDLNEDRIVDPTRLQGLTLRMPARDQPR